MTSRAPAAPGWGASVEERAPSDDALPASTVDVAIVGGGYTGLSTALHCAQAGLSAHVIEAQGVGHGGSGRNVGLVNAGVWHPPAKVLSALGPAHGPRFVEAFGNGPERVFALIERHQIRCAPTRSGTIHAAHAPSGMADLKARYREWRRLGAPVDLLNRSEVADLTGTRAFFGGLLDHRAGTINPLGYVRGLARASQAAGAGLTTGARVTALRPAGDHWRVETAAGPVEARTVILATNAYTDALWPGLAGTFSAIEYVQLATEPLGARASGILPERQGLWDTGRIMRSLRRDGAGRVILGSMGRLHGTPERGLSQRWAARQMARLFPQLGPVRFESGWHGRIAMTPDHLPRILRLSRNLYTPIGYNGRGITTGTLFGAAMADLISGADPASLPVPVATPQPVPFAGARSALLAAAFTANQALRSL
ncbi:MAG: FAD-binding oxidoreductase [Pseudomonadota bacterium]